PQGGTFAANPLSMAAGFASMEALDAGAFEHLEQLGSRLRQRLSATIERRQAPFSVTGAASLFRIHTKRRPPKEFREAFASPAEVEVMRRLSSFFASNGIIIPRETSASLSTPMIITEIDYVAEVFDRFLETQIASYASLLS